MKVRIIHLYPDYLNIYGDLGNVICLKKRAEWRKIDCQIINVSLKDDLDIKPTDIIFIGGGQDKGQLLVADDLQTKATKLKQAILKNNVPLLTICGGYQLFGNYFVTADNIKLNGIGVFNMVTHASTQRMIGNLAVRSKKFGLLVGFENHSGQTYLDDPSEALGEVIKGFGNNSRDQIEGIFVNNAIGTYMHGSFLPKNPVVADFLLSQALKNQGQNDRLNPLDDGLAELAAQAALKRPQ